MLQSGAGPRELLVLLRMELTMVARNRMVLAAAVFVPLTFVLVLLRLRDSFPAPGGLAAVQVAMMVGLGVYLTATTTLTARCQSLVLKRLRGSVLGDAEVLVGVLAPILMVNMVQLSIVLVALAALTGWPLSWGPVVMGALLAQLSMVVLAVATSGVTRSPEHAQITTVPGFLAISGLAAWIAFTPQSTYVWPKRLSPGGAALELIVRGWTGLPGPTVLLLCLLSGGWILIIWLVGRRSFRWQPRSA